jgi:PAS domain-containing protein
MPQANETTVEQLANELAVQRRENTQLRARIGELEGELVARREELRAMLDAARQTVIVLLGPEPHYPIRMANQLAADYFETTVEALIGQSFAAFCQQNRDRIADFSGFKNRLTQVIERGESIEGCEVRLTRPAKLMSLFCYPVTIAPETLSRLDLGTRRHDLRRTRGSRATRDHRRLTRASHHHAGTRQHCHVRQSRSLGAARDGI